jgi:hypothetical protein
MIKPTAMEFTHTPMVQDTKESGLMTSNTAEAKKPGKMAVSTTETT